MDMRKAMILGDGTSNRNNSRSSSHDKSEAQMVNNSMRERSRSKDMERQQSRSKVFANNKRGGQKGQSSGEMEGFDNSQDHGMYSNISNHSLTNITNLPQGNHTNNNNSNTDDGQHNMPEDAVKYQKQIEDMMKQNNHDEYSHKNSGGQRDENSSNNNDNSGNEEVMKVRLELQGSFRHARRLYIGNIPDMITVDYLTEWLYRSLEAAGGLLEPGNPIVNTQIDPKGKFAFIEMRSIEESTSMLGLDGIILWNRSLRIRRPTEYEKFPHVEGTRPVPRLDLSLLETIGIVIIPTVVDDGPNKIFLANLPTMMDEMTLLEALQLKDFGKIKAFHLVKDTNTNESKGYAFLDYEDVQSADQVIIALNDFNLYGREITVQRANANIYHKNNVMEKKFTSKVNPTNSGQNFALNELNNMMKNNFPGSNSSSSDGAQSKQQFL